MAKQNIIRLEQICTYAHAEPITDKCRDCKGYNTVCENYVPLRVYIKNKADEFERRQKEIKLKDYIRRGNAIYWAIWGER